MAYSFLVNKRGASRCELGEEDLNENSRDRKHEGQGTAAYQRSSRNQPRSMRTPEMTQLGRPTLISPWMADEILKKDTVDVR